MRSPKALAEGCDFRSHGLLQIKQGTYASLRWLRQLPFCGLAIWGHLRCKLFPADKFYKSSLYFECRIKYNEVNEKSGVGGIHYEKDYNRNALHCVVLLFAGCGKNGDTSKVEIDYGASSFIKEEIDSAIEIIKSSSLR